MKQSISIVTLGVADHARAKSFYGGYAGVFRDLDGHAWEVAHNPGFGLNEDGSVVLPEST